MKHRWIALALLLPAGCVEQLPIDGAPCPCAPGWVCCPDENVCVREGLLCPADSGPGSDAGAPRPDAGTPLVDAGAPPPSDERGVVPPVPGGYRYALNAAVASDGHFTLVAYSHAPAASLPCVNCGAPRLRGVFLDASGEELDPYGFPIADGLPDWGAIRAEPLGGRFLVGWWGGTGFSLAVVRGGDGAVVARLSPAAPADAAFDIASDGQRAVVAWVREGALVASSIDGQVEGTLAIEPRLTLCNSACTSPRLAHLEGARFAIGWTDAAGFHAAELDLDAAGGATLGWSSLVAPAAELGHDKAIAIGAASGAVLAVWDRETMGGEPASLRARRLDGSDGAALGATIVVVTSTQGFAIRHPRVVAAGADFAVLHNFAGQGPGKLGLVRVRASDGVLLDAAPVAISTFSTPWTSPDLAGVDAVWTGSALDLFWVDWRHGARRARLAPSSSAVAPRDFGRSPAPQAYPAAAALGGTVLTAFDGYERLGDGTYQRTLQAARVRADGTALDAQSIRVAAAAQGSWGGVPQVVAGADRFLVAWWDSGFTRGPHAVRASRIAASGQVLDEIVLDDVSDTSTQAAYIAGASSVAGFDGERFAVAWARDHRPTEAGQATVREGLVVTIDPVTGARSGEISLGASVVTAMAGFGGKMFLATNTADQSYDLRIRTLEGGRANEGALLCRAPRYCAVKALATSGRELVGVTWRALGTSSAAIELLQLDTRTGTVTARLTLPELVTRDQGRTWVSLAWDGASFAVLLRDETAAVHIARADAAPAGGLTRRSLAALSSGTWGRATLVPTAGESAVLVYDAIDSRLDWRRVMARPLRLE